MADDPCVVLAELESVRRRIITGEGEKVIRSRSAAGVEREIHCHAANLPALDAEIRRYRDLCDAARGIRPSRFAITAG